MVFKIKGFSMKNGKMTDETIAKLKAATGFENSAIDMEKMFGKGYKAEKI